MAMEQIEKVKREYTDKYVKVDGDRPELARFSDLVGQVKTVNMSGRALIEFQDYHLNTGWFDIDLDYLKVVDKPQPKEKKPAAKKPAAKPAVKKPAASAGKKKLSPLEMARMQGAAAKEKDGGASAKPAASKPAPAKGKMSTADILAMARGGAAKSEPAVEAAPPEPEPTPPEPTPEPVAEATPSSESSGIVKVDRSSMSVEQMIAYCREHDAK